MIRPYRSILPRIHPTAFVDESAQVIGDVEVGEESSVWMNVVVRGDVNRIRIGRRTNIQDGSIVHVQYETHPTTIGDDVTVGHGVILHGCIVGDRCLIGMGAILLNGVVIGEGSIVAAGTLLTEKTVIPSGALVLGSPGKVRRPIDADEAERIAAYAERYAAHAREYREAATSADAAAQRPGRVPKASS